MESKEPFNNHTESCRKEYQLAYEFFKQVRFHVCVSEVLTFCHSNKAFYFRQYLKCLKYQ